MYDKGNMISETFEAMARTLEGNRRLPRVAALAAGRCLCGARASGPPIPASSWIPNNSLDVTTAEVVELGMIKFEYAP